MRHKRVSKKNNGSSDPRSSLRRDMNGKIAQWKSDTRDGFELNLYVENSCCEGLKAKGVMDKYPQFQEYAYATFNGALQNARKKYNNAIRSRAYEASKLFL